MINERLINPLDDCAEACLLLMEHYSGESIVNVGAGKDMPISELATLVAEVVGYSGEYSVGQDKARRHTQKTVGSDEALLAWLESQTLAPPRCREYVRVVSSS